MAAITDQEAAAFRAMWRRGASSRSIAAELGQSVRWVKAMRPGMGLEPRNVAGVSRTSIVVRLPSAVVARLDKRAAALNQSRSRLAARLVENGVIQLENGRPS